jgi:hypothetical protein
MEKNDSGQAGMTSKQGFSANSEPAPECSNRAVKDFDNTGSTKKESVMKNRYIMGALLLIVLAGCTGAGHPPVIHEIRGQDHQMQEKAAIVGTIDQLFINTDLRDWQKVKGLFAPKVLFDMTSLAPADRRILGQGAQAPEGNTPSGGQLRRGRERERGRRLLLRHRLSLPPDEERTEHAHLRRQL